MDNYCGCVKRIWKFFARNPHTNVLSVLSIEKYKMKKILIASGILLTSVNVFGMLTKDENKGNYSKALSRTAVISNYSEAFPSSRKRPQSEADSLRSAKRKHSHISETQISANIRPPSEPNSLRPAKRKSSNISKNQIPANIMSKINEFVEIYQESFHSCGKKLVKNILIACFTERDKSLRKISIEHKTDYSMASKLLKRANLSEERKEFVASHKPESGRKSQRLELKIPSDISNTISLEIMDKIDEFIENNNANYNSYNKKIVKAVLIACFITPIKTFKEIATDYGVNRSAVQSWVRRANLSVERKNFINSINDSKLSLNENISEYQKQRSENIEYLEEVITDLLTKSLQEVREKCGYSDGLLRKYLVIIEHWETLSNRHKNAFKEAIKTKSVNLFDIEKSQERTIIWKILATRETNLIEAVTVGDAKTVKDLIEKNTDINCKDERGQTPLILATAKRHASIARFLIENGADIDCKDRDGMTALTIAKLFKCFEIIKILNQYKEK